MSEFSKTVTQLQSKRITRPEIIQILLNRIPRDSGNENRSSEPGHVLAGRPFRLSQAQV